MKLLKYFFSSIFVLVFIFSAFAQTPGLIYDPSGGTVLDPDGNGYISATNAGFEFNDQTESEIPYQKMIFPAPEPTGDISRGPVGGFGDFVDSGTEDPAQYYFDGTNLFFRMRIGAGSSASKGYSVMIDTDQKFGFTGPNADPDATANNPGFEVEVSLQTNFGVYVYNVDGRCPNNTDRVAHPGHSNYQKALALSTITGSRNSFYDFYIPFSDLTTLLPSVISSTPLRMVIITVQNPGPAICSNATADVGGIDDQNCGSLAACLGDVVENYTPTSPDNVQNNVTPLDRSNCPTISGSVTDATTSVSITTDEPAGTTLTLYNITTSTVLGTVVTDASPDTEVISFTAQTTIGHSIGATATASGKSESINNCSLKTVVAANCTQAPPTVPTIGNSAYTVTVTGMAIGTYTITVYNGDGTVAAPMAGT
ncbi:MAG: hypothetical protein ACJAVY_001338, partial [Marinoscillum sp.]